MGKHRKRPNRPDPDYETGYERAPVEHRFRPGQSGNPKGRPRKDKTVFEEFNEILMETVLVTLNGKQTRKTRQYLMLLGIANRAMKGDVRAATFMFSKREDYRGSSATVIDRGSLSAADRRLLADFVKRTQDDEKSDDDADDGSKSGDA